MSRFSIVLALLAWSGAAAAADPPFRDDGDYLVDHRGMAVYTFDKDAPGRSNCTGQCAVLWPPVHAGADARSHGRYSLVPRPDGRRQWALDGKPLYYWLSDTSPGHATGEAVPGWHLVR